MDNANLVNRLTRYNKKCLSERLDADFADAVIDAADEIVRLRKELKTCRNELCLKCGLYRERYLGSCNGCRWNESVENG